MNTLLTSLADACQVNRFTSKFLVVNSFHNGHQLLEALARSGEAWLNLTSVTPARLAHITAGKSLADVEIELIDDGQIHYLVNDVLEEMRNRGALRYFADLEGTEGPAGILKGALMEMRLAGVFSADIDPAHFVTLEKGLEIKTLLEGYEKRLNDKKLADQAAVFHKAIEILRQTGSELENAYYLVPEQLEFDYLTFTFLDLLTKNNRLVLPSEAVTGLTKPAVYSFRVEENPEPTKPFSHLYDLINAPVIPDGELDIFQAYSPSCEVKEIFRRLKKKEIRADQTLICYTNSETYLPLIHTLASTYRIPATYADGLPAAFSGPGALLAGLLNWMEENYASYRFYRLLTTGSLQIEGKMTLARLLRQVLIGWGRDRYKPCIDKLEKDLADGAESAEKEGRQNLKTYLLRLQEHAARLKTITAFILNHIPAPGSDNTLPFDRLCLGLGEIIEEYSPIATALDRSAKESLRDMLVEASHSCSENISLPTAVQRIKTRFGALHVIASASAPGHLHIASIGQGEWSFRPHSFVVGLAGGHFPGSGLQDPILLDRERKEISPNLALVTTYAEDNLYRLNRLLASRRGKITLSFPSFEPVEGRPSFPASILLQAFRLQSGQHEADYSTLLKTLARPASYSPTFESEALSADEWWLSLVLGKQKSGDLQGVKACYPGIAAGLTAEEFRRSKHFTKFDGRVCIDPNEVDPRLNKARTLSASAVEKLANCPFSYFLKYILRVEPPEEQAFDRWAWLDPLTRGSLLHRIYAAYLKETYIDQKKPSPCRARLIKIAEEEIENTAMIIPPPNPIIFAVEKSQLLQGLEIFLQVERELWEEESSPVGLEVPFGFGPDEIKEAGMGLEDPLEVTLPDGSSVLIRGRIDRLDFLQRKGTYRILDYKTGSAYGYDSRTYLKQGRQIQHALYTLAAEAILQQNDLDARVEDAGYIFPTEKGEGERYLRRQNRPDDVLTALELILEILAAGAFCTVEDREHCTFCDYKSVCRFPRTLEDTKRKLEHNGNKELDPWRRLQDCE